jgi:hypothetical protein
MGGSDALGPPMHDRTEKLALIELARTWTQAVQQSGIIFTVKASPPEARAD